MSPIQKEKTNNRLRWYNAILITFIAVESTATGFWIKAFIERSNNDHDNVTSIRPRVDQLEKSCFMTSEQLKQAQGELDLHDYRINFLMQYAEKDGYKKN